MDKEPRLLVWNYTVEEKEKLDALLKEIGAPSAMTIESTQGNIPLREIIHKNSHGEGHFASDEKALLFYGIPQKGVFLLINMFKQAHHPRAIYAVVTEHSIEWSFSELLAHLVCERNEMERRRAGESGERS